MAHKTDYRFYIQKLPGGSANPKKDLETTYGCDYMCFQNIIKDGDIQNVYEESFAEKSGVRVYVPAKADLAFKSYECKLKLLFRGATALANAKRFQNDMRGTKIEYSDTFRNIFATLLITKGMEIEKERLYGDQQYVVAEYTFTNINGRTYDTSQL